MKNFKKALLLGLAFLGVGAITACNNNNSGNGTTDVTDAATEAIEKVLFPQNDTEVTGNFDVVGSVKYNGDTYNLTWTSDKDVIKFNTVDGKTKAIVNFTGNTQAAQEVKLTVSVTVAEKTVKKTFKVTVPKFTVNTLAEADAAAAKTTLTLKGVIVAKEPYSATNKNTSVYLMCDGGGYEAYRLACTQDQYDKELVVGNTIYVSGPKGYYNGLRELNTCTYVFDENAAKVTVTAEDLTSLVSAGTGIADTYQCHLAKLTDVEIVKIDTPDSSGQYSIYVGDPTDDTKQAVVRISKYFFTGKTADDYQFKDLNLVAGQKITVTGFVGWYNGAQITPIAADGIVAGQVDYASGLASAYQNAAKKSIGAQVVPMKTVVLPSRLADLGLSGEDYEAYTIEWSTESTDVEIKTKNIAAKAEVPATETTPAVPAEAAYVQYSVETKKPEADADVTLVVKVKDASGTVVATRDVTFKLLKEVTYNTHAEYVAAAKDTELYVKGTIAFIKEKDNKTIYLQDDDGNGYYLYFPAAQSGEWLEVGNVIGVFGKVSPYQGMQELANCVFIEQIGTEKKAVTVTDYTETFTTTDFNSLEVADQCKVVKFNGVVKSVASGNFVITVGEKEVNVYAGNAKTLPTFAANDKVTVTGLLGVNVKTSGDTTTTTYQVILVNTADMVANMTDEEKLASAVSAVEAAFSSDTYVATTTVTVPANFDATITLAEDLAEGSVLAFDAETKKVTITPTATAAEETLKLKVVVGEAEQVVQITIKAQLSETNVPITTANFKETLDANFTFGTDEAENATKLGLNTENKSIFTAKATNNSASNTAIIHKNDSCIKIYDTKTSIEGGQITITIAEGYIINSVELTVKTSPAGVAGVYNTAEATTGTEITATEGVYTINSRNVSIKNITDNTASTVQLHISAIKIVYSKVSD